MGAFHTLDEADFAGKRVLVRVDLNVPMVDGKVTDDTRIRAAAPTVNEIADKGGRVILLAHFGRPKAGPDSKYSLKPVVPAIAAVIGLSCWSTAHAAAPKGLGDPGALTGLQIEPNPESKGLLWRGRDGRRPARDAI